MSTSAADTPTGSAGPSRNTSPPAQVPVSPNTVMLDQWKSTLAQLVKTSKMSRSRGSALAEKPEVQAMLDKDLFLIQSDRRTKMNPVQQLQMCRVLAQFFLERVDDGHRYSYFEAIFLGRAEDAILHEYRVSVMFQLVALSAQYPCLQMFNHVMGWLCQMKNEELEQQYSDRLILMIVDGFVRTANDKNQLHEYLKPLDLSCSEFCALFVARAPLHGKIRPPMAQLIVKYCSRNMQFILRHLRDTPWLGNDFAETVVPKIIEQTLRDGVNKEGDALVSCLCYILLRWHIDVVAMGERKGPVKRIEVIDMLLSPDYAWTKRRSLLLAAAIGATNRSESALQKQIRDTPIPSSYQQVIDLVCEGKVKENGQKVIDNISDMHLEAEMVERKYN